MMVLKIGALSIPTLAGLELEQTYEPLGGEAIFRTVSGRGIKQSTWRKTRVSISGSGWLPAGLEAIDTTLTQVVSCIVPRAVPAVFATRQATLPAARRSDSGHLPWGVAIMSDGTAVSTAASLAGNVATLAPVASAVAYQALYLPQITAWVSRPIESGSRGDASYRWEISAEEE